MPDTSRSRLAELLRTLTFGLERLAAEEAATSAVHGASEGLRRELDGAAGELRAWLERVGGEAARAALESLRDRDGLPVSAAQAISGATTRGALDELERQWAEGGLPLHAVADRVDRLLEDVTRVASAWERDRLDPSDRARKLATELVRGAVAELRSTFGDREAASRAVSRAAREVGFALGQGVAEGIATGARTHVRELSASAARGAGDGLAAAAGEHAPPAARACARGIALAAAAAVDGTVSAARRAVARVPLAWGALLVAAILVRRR